MNGKKIVWFSIAVASTVWVAAVFAKPDPVTSAGKLLKTHYYDSAAKTLQREMHALGNNASANFALGLAYHKNSILHQELYNSSLETENRYMEKLIKRFKKNKSKYAYLYYGEALASMGDHLKALKYYKRFKSRRGVEKKYKDISTIASGTSNYYLGNKSAAIDIWKNIKTSDKDVLAELAVALYTTGSDKKKAGKIVDDLVNSIGNNKITPRILNAVLLVYATPEKFGQALQLLQRTDISVPDHVENIGKQKTLRFYKMTLSKAMSEVFRQAAQFYLNRAKSEQKYLGVSEYYLAESAMYFATDKSSISDIGAIHTVQLPEKLATKGRIQTLVVKYLQKKGAGISEELEAIAAENKTNPDVLADVVNACSRISQKCYKALGSAKAVSNRMSGKTVRTLNMAIGNYYLQQNIVDVALEYLETGRDKNMKNRIDTNDPVLLVNLAKVYLANKSFSENLEIYFELSKEFPVVRNIQNAVQGIYSMEFKSAGDVKIF
ncbi:MAG: hypothetical protein OEZ68_06140 [Gammaproteobacteria bacterium]|nr:hypothetical protein [Gammaproteobacteria bacterium]MDH5800369.1 hypothetical protein [Gammaproteobacteria bacterium]